MEKYEKPVMEIDLFDEDEREILTTGDGTSGDNVSSKLKSLLPTRESY